MQGKWIWYPGDFEIYHGMLQNFQREERGYGWPAYWKMDDWRKNIRFYKEYHLEKTTEFCVHGYGEGYISVDGKKYPMEKKISCDAGHHLIEVFIGSMTGLPCIYINGEVIYSNEEWMADDFVEKHPVGISSLYLEKNRNPNQIYYETEKCIPKEVKKKEKGILFDFQRMINGTLEVWLEDKTRQITVCYGESEMEACDTQWCYYKQEQVANGYVLKRRAFRYVFIPEGRIGEVNCIATHQYVPIEVKAKFWCDDEMINRIWETAKDTYCLCSGLFFVDGIKRDRWIWSGDAYQSFFVNPYLFFDEEIDKRTLLALRGNKEIVQHINTIVDYSMLWLIGVEKEYQMTGDLGFVNMIYPKMVSMITFLENQTDDNGFIYGREQDWVFIDWSDIDKEGAVCAEQILLLQCYKTMQFCASLTGNDPREYKEAFQRLKKNIMDYFWLEEKGAFIDSFASGKNHVTRHANIFAVLFDLIDEEQTESIIQNVLMNPDIPQITTPYFKFFELDVWGKTGYLDKLYDSIKDYWGGMIEKGAVTFWEEYTPGQQEPEQYEMYGDPFGKSLCHAWGASPIYLLGRYFLGVRSVSSGYGEFVVEPKLEYFNELECVVPVKDGKVWFTYRNGKLEVCSDRAGGKLLVDGEEKVIQQRSAGEAVLQ